MIRPTVLRLFVLTDVRGHDLLFSNVGRPDHVPQHPRDALLDTGRFRRKESQSRGPLRRGLINLCLRGYKLFETFATTCCRMCWSVVISAPLLSSSCTYVAFCRIRKMHAKRTTAVELNIYARQSIPLDFQRRPKQIDIASRAPIYFSS